MVLLTELWLPILLSAIFVFLVSAAFHMLLPHHRNDFGPVPDEDRLQEDLRRAGLPPGDYSIPYAPTPKAMSEPEYVEKMTRGPLALITIAPSGPPAMGKSLTLWFLYSLAVSYASAYIAGRALGPGADYLEVFRFVTTAAFLGYVFGLWQQSIWYFRPWRTSLKSTVDGLVYALITAGTFGWLWP